MERLPTVDAYDESEPAVGFFTMMEELLAFPFTARVLGQEVTAAEVDITHRDQIVAVCLRGETTQCIPILDLPLPSPLPAGAEWIERSASVLDQHVCLACSA